MTEKSREDFAKLAEELIYMADRVCMPPDHTLLIWRAADALRLAAQVQEYSLCQICGSGAVKMKFDGSMLESECSACGSVYAGSLEINVNAALGRGQRAQEDAERYRFLCDQERYPYRDWWPDKVDTATDKEAMDAVIDAAIAAEKVKP